MTESEDAHMERSDGRARVIISGVKPEVDMFARDNLIY